MSGVWKKTLIYLGLVEDDEELEDYAYDDLEPEARPASRSQPRRAQADAEPPGQPSYAPRRDAVVRAIPTPASAGFHLVEVTGFQTDAQEIGDRFRQGYSVLLNLQSVTSREERQRIVDFASGLAYGVTGQLKPAGERVYLLTPPGVEVSADEPRRFMEERGFFSQA
ncbi:MAG: cell division protein SepF [Actinomycetota bacterium]|nr:cell division protein SepF [Actinomycetota bacterium]